MSKPRSHQLDIYGGWLHCATTPKQWRALRRQLPSLAEDPGGQGAVSLTLHEADNGLVTPHLAVWLDLKATGDGADLVELIAHEAFHAGGALLDHIGQAYDGDSEALAYLVGFIAAWLWQACT